MDYVITIKNADPAELQRQLDEAAGKGYRPVSNIFIHGNTMCIFMVRTKAPEATRPKYLIGAGRRIEEITRWVNGEYENGWRVMEGYEPIEFNNFMYILVKNKK